MTGTLVNNGKQFTGEKYALQCKMKDKLRGRRSKFTGCKLIESVSPPKRPTIIDLKEILQGERTVDYLTGYPSDAVLNIDKVENRADVIVTALDGISRMRFKCTKRAIQ